MRSRILGGLLVAASVALLAQDQKPTFRTGANYIRVDAYPTKDGAPVTDLTQDEFEILEDRTPQTIEQFERVNIRGNLPQEVRVEPNTVAESRSMVESSRARLFVVFLDTYHVTLDGSHNIRQPLVTALDQLIGPDDLVGIMTPEMSARDVTFARKTTTIAGFLARYWPWGEKDRAALRDKTDEEYGACYPNEDKPIAPGQPDCTGQNGIAAEMIDRRHEKLSLDSLEDLVLHLRGVREERKAIIAITNGWLLYRPNDALRRPLACGGQPPKPPIGVDPRGGKLTTKPDPNDFAPPHQCEMARISLSNLDNDRTFKDILNEANAANASLYPIDPRGLPVFDTPLMRLDVPGPPPPVVPLQTDNAMLRQRTDSLRTLAENTDGLAMVNSNNLAAGFKRIVADLSSYYLLGYYSSGKLDGRYHSITVRVKRPGVQVRARRGYLAATPAAAARIATADATTPKTAADVDAHAMETIVAPLNAFGRELPIRLQTAAGYTPGGSAAVWVVGEFGTGEEWRGGAEVDVMLMSSGGAMQTPLATAHASVPTGARTFRLKLTATSPIAAGDYAVRVRARSASSTTANNETTGIVVSPAPASTGAIFFRRGVSTGNREVATADLRFRRNEQVRVEIPAAAVAAPTARLLDRTGKALAIPVNAAVRDDADGSRWMTAHVVLAPLAPGDYVIEIAQADGAGGGASAAVGTTRTLAAFRVVP